MEKWPGLVLAILSLLWIIVCIHNITKPTDTILNLTEAVKEGKEVCIPLKSGGYACFSGWEKWFNTCSGKTIYDTNTLDFDTPFFIGNCAMGSGNVVLVFKKNCTLEFRSIDFRPSKGYINISAYSNGPVQYILCILNGSGNYTVNLGNLKLKCSRVIYFNKTGEYSLYITLNNSRR